MPRILYTHICEYARVDPNGTVSIIGIFDTITVPSVPAKFPFLHVITSLTGQRGEQFQFFTRIAGPDGVVLQSAPAGEIKFTLDDQRTNQINGYLGPVFPTFGIYTVELVIDGMVVHTIPFRLLQQREVAGH